MEQEEVFINLLINLSWKLDEGAYLLEQWGSVIALQ